MEKINLGLSMANTWTGPVMILLGCGVSFLLCVIGVVGAVWTAVSSAVQTDDYMNIDALGLWGWAIALSLFYFGYNFLYLQTGEADTTKFIEFADTDVGRQLKSQFADRRIPVVTLYDAYMNMHLDFKKDVYETFLYHRYEFIAWRPTWTLLMFLLEQFVPGKSSSFKDKKSTKKEIADHYDRGNDFFACFLGDAMVYTSGVFHGTHQSLEQAQVNKMDMICNKLQIKPGMKTLDIGCGWGTLVRHMAMEFGADATGVTLSLEGEKWCNDMSNKCKCEDKVEILCKDYREIPHGTKFDAISSVEMAEHVGLANFQLYLRKVRDLLTDDGMFVCQVSGVRQAPNWEDTMWGLFMSRYIFPGADASTPCHWYTKEFEKAGFEIHSCENVNVHYAHTLNRWYLNWIKPEHKAHIVKKYGGEHLYRLWAIFLAWSSLAPVAAYGSCYQFLVHPNERSFPRDVFCNPDGENTSGQGRSGVGLHNLHD
jgi:cyclopropane fatty-acyl-phospholipid synthase-like methyltransferase